MRRQYIAEHDFVSGRNNDVYDVPANGFLYSMVVGKNVCTVVDHYDVEKAGFQYGFGPRFPIDGIRLGHLYRVLYVLEGRSFDLCVLEISDAF